MEPPSTTKMTLATSEIGFPARIKPLPRIMYGEESRGVPLYINNYGKADHGGGRPQVRAVPIKQYSANLFCPGAKRKTAI